MYGPEAIARRRCTATRKDGRPCGAWACWTDPDQRCAQHCGRGHTGPQDPRTRFRTARPAVVPCRCVAYNWPHRPGAGLCRWPEPPEYRRTTPAGTHQHGVYRRRIRQGRICYEWR